MQQKISLVLEGGGMRGIYTAGVLDVFMKYDIWFDSVFAVSAGACHAVSYVSRQRGRSYKIVNDYANDWRYLSKRSLLLTGDMFGAKFVYQTIPDKLIPFDYDAFRENPMRLYAVVTNLDTGLAEYLPVRDAKTEIDKIRASASLPGISRTVKIDGEKYLDGGISDSIPVQRALEETDKAVVVLTRQRGYVKHPTSMGKQVSALYRRYPEFIEAVKTRHIRYNDTLKFIEEKEKEGKVLVIQPKAPLDVKRTERNIEKLQPLYQDGVNDTEECIAKINQFIDC